jgi:hypothetical protein
VGPLVDQGIQQERDSLLSAIDRGKLDEFFQSQDNFSNLFPDLYDDHPATVDSLASGLKQMYYARSSEVYMFIWEPLESYLE